MGLVALDGVRVLLGAKPQHAVGGTVTSRGPSEHYTGEYFQSGNYADRPLGRLSMYWFARRYFAELVRRHAPQGGPGRALLEIGCGLGDLLGLLQDEFGRPAVARQDIDLALAAVEAGPSDTRQERLTRERQGLAAVWQRLGAANAAGGPLGTLVSLLQERERERPPSTRPWCAPTRSRGPSRIGRCCWRNSPRLSTIGGRSAWPTSRRVGKCCAFSWMDRSGVRWTRRPGRDVLRWWFVNEEFE